MAQGGNSIEDVLAGILRREGDSIAILNVLNAITVAQTDQVSIQYTLPDGTIQTFPVPSIGYIISKILALEQNQQNMMGISTTKVAVKLPDGTLRTIYTTEIPSEPNPVIGVPVPVNFDIKNNPIIEELIDPTTFISVTLTGLIAADVQKINVKKIVLDPANAAQIDFFNKNYNGVNSIDYNQLIDDLGVQGIVYSQFDFIEEVELRLPRYSGTFDVVNIFKRKVTVSVNGVSQEQSVLVYKLNKSTYTNNETNADVNLKVGDVLVIDYTDIHRSSYQIQTIDLSTNECTLLNLEGYDVPKVGINIFAISPLAQTRQIVDLTVNNNQYVIFFFKPIEGKNWLIARSWGQGIGVYTSALLEVDTAAKLSDFYATSVQDIVSGIKRVASDGQVSIAEAIIPDAPVLNVADFHVVLDNTHQNSLASDQAIKDEYAQKLTIQSNIAKIDVSINALKLQIATGSFTTTQELTNANDQLAKLNSERDTNVSQLATIVNDLVSKTQSVPGFEPVYAVQGYWPIPDPKYTDAVNKVGEQQVVRFIIEYRYLKIDNTSSESQTITFGPDNDKQKAVPPKWIRLEGVARKKAPNQFGQLVWSSEDLLNPDTINCNYLSIPIAQGENVEIRVKSQSEAGWPISPVESDWSASIIVQFPQELVDTTDSIRTEVQNDQIQLLFQQQLDADNLPQHLSDQITINERYFAHDSKHIQSPFRTAENKPIPVDEAITTLSNDVAALQAIINKDTGKIGVVITDDLGNTIATVNNNTNVKLFAGYYQNLIANAVIKKGEIVNVLYYIVISNLSQADLELLAYVPGNTTEQLPDGTYTGYLINSSEYKQYREYWQAPLTLRGINNDASLLANHTTTTKPFIEVPSFQSSQVKGQLLYSRARDITLNNFLYWPNDGAASPNPAAEVFAPVMTGASHQAFIWDGSQTFGPSPNGNGFASDFAVHVDHPDLQQGTDFMNKYAQLWNGNGIPSANNDNQEIFYPHFYHSAYFNKPATDPVGYQQLAYRAYTTSLTPGIGNFARKFGFSKNDKYLIGQNTCGAYLSLSPTDTATIGNNSPIYNVGTIIKQGSQYSLKVGVLFSCRMTDYYGAGSTGSGILGGFGSNYPANLEFTKKIGIDIAIANQPLFSFDIEVQMIYKPSSVAT